ncbi:CorA family divalent cation transporter [Streptomyces sp. AM 4-1-1]|nr:CorA family divalent cation transporter [Streptomyces sp. AM 4-1-1]WEH37692.1 CorA family divalent cation transporter [Streptomyces sp. AM 4-1-1]
MSDTGRQWTRLRNLARSRKALKDSSAQVRGNEGHIAAGQRRQVDNFKKISAWAAILFAPTLVGTICGMNFDLMPELHRRLGYPFAIGLMAVVCGGLYLVFKRRDWL